LLVRADSYINPRALPKTTVAVDRQNMSSPLLDQYLLVILITIAIFLTLVLGAFLFGSRRAKEPEEDPLESFGPHLEYPDWPPKDW